MDTLGLRSWLLYLNVWITLCTQADSTEGPPRIVEHPQDSYVAKQEPYTMNCKAEGNPTPIITWYRNGQRVQTAVENPASHRLLLDGRQLFFLEIIHSKTSKPDVGTYYCNATNIHGTAISHNATLEIAVIRDDFRIKPRNTRVAFGDPVQLQCQGPRGHPEPQIRWKKNGEFIQDNNHAVVLENGNLIIAQGRKADSGTYICVASNIAGDRESRPATLEILTKPRITRRPRDKTITVNNDVTFRCGVSGDPEPSGPNVIWEKEGGHLENNNRARKLSDNSLRIEGIQVSDEGVYVCKVSNYVGATEARARLTVHSHPSFVRIPVDKIVGVGRTVSLRCVVTGNPPPTVIWNQVPSEVLLFADQPRGRLSVNREGTLRITDVHKEDAGSYRCQGLNVVGQVFTTANIEVVDVDPRPPPIITEGPKNQTLSVSGMALLRCQSAGDPAPYIRWLKDNNPITDTSARITLLSSGSLQVSDLRPSDAGLYTCVVVSESGETHSSASLSISSNSGPPIIYHSATDSNNKPGPPSKPEISESDISDTTVHLRWTENSHEGAAPVTTYAVEYMSYELGRGWIVASSNVPDPWFTVRSLIPGTHYVFVVKARNSFGYGLPSERSEPVQTRGGDSARPVMSLADIARVQRELSGRIIHLANPEVLSSSSLKITWQILKSHNSVEGFLIKFRPVKDGDDAEYTEKKLSVSSLSEYTLTQLDMYTEYEIRIQPYFWTVFGEPSNGVVARTDEGVPSAAPQSIEINWGNETTLIVTWMPPLQENRNGIIKGYKIYCLTDEPKFGKNVTVRDASVRSVTVANLKAGKDYRVQVAAFTDAGLGTASSWQKLGKPLGESTKSLVKETWFIATLIGSIGGVLFCGLLIFSIFLLRKRRARKRKKLTHNGIMNADHQHPDVTNINDHNKLDTSMYNGNGNENHHHLKTFYNKNHAIPEVSPYAMSNIVTVNNRMNKQTTETSFRPINGGYIKPTSDGSGDSCLKPDMNSDTNTENSRPNTGSTELPHEDHMTSPISDIFPQIEDETALQCYMPNYRGAPPRVNFMDIAPPPPEYPPPSDIGTPPDTPPHSRGVSPCRSRLDRSYGRNLSLNSSHRGSPCCTIHSQHSNGSGGSHRTYYSKNGSTGSRNTDNEQRGVHAHMHSNSPSRTQQHYSSDSSKSRQNRSQSPKKYSSASETERGPTPPVRAYKLVPINNMNELRGSDADRGPTPPVRMYAIHSPTSPNSLSTTSNMDRGIQSSLPSLASECIRSPTARLEIGENGPQLSLFSNGGDSPPEGIPYYAESDVDMSGRDAGSPVSSVGDFEASMTGSMMASWASITDQSDTNCSSMRSSVASSSDGSYLAEADFASAVARAAELSGYNVVGSTIVDPNPGAGNKQKKRRERARRPSSPYSTDSNFSAVQHKPYPKSERKRQIQQQGNGYNNATNYNTSSQDSPHHKTKPAVRAKPAIPQNVGDIPSYNRPSFPSPTHHSPTSTNSRSTSSSGSKMGQRTSPSTMTHRDNGYTVRMNPLSGMDVDEDNKV